MPQFDLRGIKTAKYINTNGSITHGNTLAVGDAMTANLEMRYAEGRLYAESTLAEFMKKATGGTISLGVKYIPNAAQQLMFGSRSKSRTVSYTPSAGGEQTSGEMTSLVLGAKTDSQYVSVGFYAPDMIDGVEKYTCVYVAKCLFGPPSLTLQTAGENIQFNTPVTSGEFLADDSETQDMLEVAIVDDENAAIAWVQAVLA